MELQGRLLQMGMLRLQLLSTWWREFQILPGRSHPSMNMSADGGFILTGIKVTRAPEEEGGFGEEDEEEGEEGNWGGVEGRGALDLMACDDDAMGCLFGGDGEEE